VIDAITRTSLVLVELRFIGSATKLEVHSTVCYNATRTVCSMHSSVRRMASILEWTT
jgi:hypothetical protein